MKVHDLIVLGAGVAGLQCARRLQSTGADILVMDRSGTPGGRCATRTFEGQPADFGPVFIHGDHPGFLAAVAAVDAERIDGWPLHVSGTGTPCQPRAYAASETRLAFREGVNAFPRSLAAGLPLRLGAQAASVALADGFIAIVLSSGEALHARTLVLALALEQSLPFVSMLEGNERVKGVRATLDLFTSVPCLTVIAGYDGDAPTPDWDILYPEDEPALLLVSNESSKRPEASSRIIVYQASAPWSHQRLDTPKEEWRRELLQAAARRLGPWAAAPRWTHPHRWRYSRLDRTSELTRPIDIDVGGARLALVGELFSRGGGLQAAWLAGDRLGETLSARKG